MSTACRHSKPTAPRSGRTARARSISRRDRPPSGFAQRRVGPLSVGRRRRRASWRPTCWLDGDTDFRHGGITFRLDLVRRRHSPEDLMMYVVEDRTAVLPATCCSARARSVRRQRRQRGLAEGDGQDAGARIRPSSFPVTAARRATCAATSSPRATISLYLRAAMGRAVQDLEPFDDAYAKDRLVALPADCRRSTPPTASTPTARTC